MSRILFAICLFGKQTVWKSWIDFFTFHLIIIWPLLFRVVKHFIVIMIRFRIWKIQIERYFHTVFHSFPPFHSLFFSLLLCHSCFLSHSLCLYRFLSPSFSVLDNNWKLNEWSKRIQTDSKIISTLFTLNICVRNASIINTPNVLLMTISIHVKWNDTSYSSHNQRVNYLKKFI